MSASWPAAVPGARAAAQAALGLVRLPFRGHLWRGRAGSWLGSGRGASLEFQDHRAYAPGDDPRHINWQAYARTGAYSMKLYREEVSPGVDVALDASASMILTDAKARRGLELLLFAVLCGRAAGAAVRAWMLAGEDATPLHPDALAGADLALFASPAAVPPSLGRVPWRAGSMRVLVTDGLYEAAPETLLARLCAGNGRGVVLMPSAAEESEPDWSGALELKDCESDTVRELHVDDGVVRRYRDAYRRHFAAWDEAGRRFGAAVARVPSDGSLVEALRREALEAGAVEPA